MKTRLRLFVISLVLALGSQSVRSATILWTNIAGGNWNTPANWSPNQVPVAADDAVITNSGTYTITLNVSATVASLTIGGTSGTQSFVANANTLTLKGASSVGTNGSFDLGGGTLGGIGSFTINGPFNWNSGVINNTGGVTLNGISTLTGVGNGAMQLYGLLINGGQLSWGGNGNNLYLDAGGTLTNLATGTITINANVSTFPSVPPDAGKIGNAGLLRKIGGTGTTSFAGVPFHNSGTVQVLGGTLVLPRGGSSSGTFELSANATLELSGANHNWNAPIISGQGTVRILGVVNLSGAITINNITSLDLSGGVLSGAGSLTVNGLFNWNSGALANTGGVTLNGTSTFNGGNMELDVKLVNGGLITWSGSGKNLRFSGGTFTNLASGTITITSDVSTFDSFASGNFGNAGLVRKIGGTGTTTIANGISFINTGTLDVRTGTINLDGAHNLTNGTLNFGISSPTDFGTINLSGTADLTGTVGANLSNGFIPISGDSFAVVTYGSMTGIFTNTVLPFAQAWQTNYTATNFTLVVLNARIFGGVIRVNELSTLVTNVVTGLDTYAHAVVSSLISAPSGMMLNTNTGIITWTPDQTQSPSTNTVTVIATDNGEPVSSATNSFTVIVVEVNVAPTFIPPADQVVNALASLTVTNAAIESNIHSMTIGYGLINPPSGMNINGNGIITWTPSLSQGPSTNMITTVVTNYNPFDLINPNLTTTNSFLVVVFMPTLTPLGNFTVNVGQTVTFNASATDNDNTRTLAFSLGTAPATASINPVSGLFSWRPPAMSAGSSNNIQVIVTDNNVPTLSATQSFYVRVNALTPVTLVPRTKTATQFQMQVTGPVGPDYVLQANHSLDGETWTNLLTNNPASSPFNLDDTNLTGFSNRFYRVELAP